MIFKIINIGISETIEGKKLVKWKALKTQLTSYLHHFVKNGASLIIIFYHISRFSWLRRCMLGFAKGQFIVTISKVAIKNLGKSSTEEGTAAKLHQSYGRHYSMLFICMEYGNRDL